VGVAATYCPETGHNCKKESEATSAPASKVFESAEQEKHGCMQRLS